MKPLPVQLLPIASCLLHVAPCEERASILFVAALLVLEYCNEVPLSLLFSKEKREGLSSLGRLSIDLIIFVGLLWTISSLSTAFLNSGHGTPRVACQAQSRVG